MLRVFRSLVQRRNFALSRVLRSEEEIEVGEVDEGQLGPTTSWTPPPFELEEENELTDFEMPPKEYTEPRKVVPGCESQRGDFRAGKYQGFGNTDYLDDTYRPEWRTGYSIRDRYHPRVNNPNLLEPFQSHWNMLFREEWEVEKHMDLRWDQYVETFGYTPPEYFETEAFRARYGDDEKVWWSYFKNKKNSNPPQMAREACFTPAKVSLNACPMHRDYQLLVHYKNIPLFKQFMCPTMGNIMSPLRTGLCMQAHLELEVALTIAWNKGIMLQPLHHWRPSGGWDYERRPENLNPLRQYEDRYVHFSQKPTKTLANYPDNFDAEAEDLSQELKSYDGFLKN